MWWLRTIALFLRTLLRDRAELAAENLALRQQLAVLERQSKRPRLRKRDRIFWAWLSRLWGAGAPSSSSSSPKRLCAGIGRASSCIGDGSHGSRSLAARKSTLRSAG